MSFQHTLQFDNSFANQLEGFYAPWHGVVAPSPSIVEFNIPLAHELGLSPDDMNNAAGALFFSGTELPENAAPLAQVYAGHQFGGFSPQLGDGRALLLGEVIDANGARRDIQLKGSGRTPFSRGGDGKAGLGPVLREYLISEAMHAFGIPTTRALAAVTTGEQIWRDELQPGAILVRIASSHLRVGTFQYFAARGELEKLRKLADYAIERHYPATNQNGDKYLGLLANVAKRQAALVAKWMSVGFVHGVMNTDNVTISGETIDFGPCAFMDAYDPKTVFSSIDQHGRYAYGNQPAIAQWNLARFAESLLPLINSNDSDQAADLATTEIDRFAELYQHYRLAEMRAKIGLTGERPDDETLIDDLLDIMQGNNMDFTQTFRLLADAARGDDKLLLQQTTDQGALLDWLARWRIRIENEAQDPQETTASMDAANPLYIPRNHKVEEALQAAVKQSDFSAFKKLLSVLSKPYEKRPGLEDYERPGSPELGPYTTFCGT